MKKIKIVFLLGSLRIGGTETQFLECLRHLDRKHFSPQVLSFPSSGIVREEIERLGVPFTGLGCYSISKGSFHPGTYIRLCRILWGMFRFFRQVRPDIVQSYLFWTNIFGAIVAKISGVPTIITGRRETMEAKYNTFSKQCLLGLSNMCSTAIIANSQKVKQDCLEQEFCVKKKEIQVIYNGIDLQTFPLPSTVSRERRKEFRIPEGVFVIGMVARLHPRKGHRDVLLAAPTILKAYPQTIFLLIGGDQGCRTKLEGTAEEMGISESLIFAGERRDIPEMISMFDILVSASYVEGLSNAIIEAMASEKPVVATDIAGNTELVLPHKTGLLVPPKSPKILAEAVLHLLGDKALREHMGAAGRLRVRELCRIQRMIGQTEAFYQKFADP